MYMPGGGGVHSVFRCVDVNTPMSEWHVDELLKHPAETTAATKTFTLYWQAAKVATKA